MCCKLPYVAELAKPVDTWCAHARPGHGGCAIYPDRPRTCREFVCGWLAGAVDDVWYPARCKMILAAGKNAHELVVTVDPAFPTAWRREPYYPQLLAWAQDRRVQIRIGLRIIQLNADRDGTGGNLQPGLDRGAGRCKFGPIG